MSKKRGTKMVESRADAVLVMSAEDTQDMAHELCKPVPFASYAHNQPRARSRTFTAKPCSVCQALREPDTNFTRVYATRDRVRYCRCTYCNNTWKDSDG
jgi:hypothetical protein